MSSPNTDTTVQPTDNDSSASITPDGEGNHPVSSPERLPLREDIPNFTTTQNPWNGDPMDWESWPTGRPGPLVSEGAMQKAMNWFHAQRITPNDHPHRSPPPKINASVVSGEIALIGGYSEFYDNQARM